MGDETTGAEGARGGPIRTVAVFCGARTGRRASHAAAAAAFGRGLAERGMALVYGGGRAGLMGVVADAALAAGGRVSGVIPAFLGAREQAHPGVADLSVTDTMHARKAIMFARADAFVTLPGGLGTLDETVEIATWRQLGLHDKPILVVDVDGWASGLLAAFEAAIADGFAGPETRDLLEVVPDVETALARLGRLAAGRASPGAPALL